MIISLLEKEIPYIDVRAPIEFAQGALPTSKNLPILNDKERERVGKAYKKSGGQAATELGYILVKDEIKDQRVDDWVNFVNLNPNDGIHDNACRCMKNFIKDFVTIIPKNCII